MNNTFDPLYADYHYQTHNMASAGTVTHNPPCTGDVNSHYRNEPCIIPLSQQSSVLTQAMPPSFVVKLRNGIILN